MEVLCHSEGHQDSLSLKQPPLPKSGQPLESQETPAQPPFSLSAPWFAISLSWAHVGPAHCSPETGAREGWLCRRAVTQARSEPPWNAFPKFRLLVPPNLSTKCKCCQGHIHHRMLQGKAGVTTDDYLLDFYTTDCNWLAASPTSLLPFVQLSCKLLSFRTYSWSWKVKIENFDYTTKRDEKQTSVWRLRKFSGLPLKDSDFSAS